MALFVSPATLSDFASAKSCRYDKLESHVLDLVDLLKTRALQEEALEGRSVYTGAESVLRRDSSIRGSLF